MQIPRFTRDDPDHTVTMMHSSMIAVATLALVGAACAQQPAPTPAPTPAPAPAPAPAATQAPTPTTPATLQAAASTRATVVVSLTPPRGVQGLTPGRIVIDYGQPHLRGRALHTGGLVPLDSIWRLGANQATGLETDVDLVIGGLTVPKGKYTMYALPSAGGWKLIINANTGQWGTQYAAQHDLGRVDLRKRTLASPVEAFSMWLVPSTEPGLPRGELRFAWGNVELATDWSMKAP